MSLEQAALEWLTPRASTWGYALLFLLPYLESAAFVGFFVPGETAVLLGGALAANGVLPLDHVIAVTLLAAVLGDTTGYFVGQRFGPRLFARKHGLLFNRVRLRATQRFFRRHGGKAVLFGRFVSWLRPLVPFVAGTSHMHYPKFLFFNAYGGVVWTTTFSLLGYALGSQWETVKRAITHVGFWALAFVAILVLLYLLFRRRRHTWRRRLRRLDAFLSNTSPQLWSFVKHRLRNGSWRERPLTLAAIVALACAALVLAMEWSEARRLADAAEAGIDSALVQLPPFVIRLGRITATIARIATWLLLLWLGIHWARERAWLHVAVLFGVVALGALMTMLIGRPPSPQAPAAAALYALLAWAFGLRELLGRLSGEIARTSAYTLGGTFVLLAGLGGARIAPALAGYGLAGMLLAGALLVLAARHAPR